MSLYMLVVQWIKENGLNAKFSSYSQNIGCLNFHIKTGLALHICVETNFIVAALIDSNTRLIKQTQIEAADPAFFIALRETIDASYSRNQEKAS